MQDLENMEMYTKGITSAVIVGGGLIGIEMAEMLRSRNIEVTFMVRESSFWNVVLPPEESEMINRHIREHHVDLRLKTELKEIRSDDSGRATSVVTNDGEEIPCQFVGLTTGVSPNIGFLANSGIELDRGVLVNHYFETNMPDVYAVGDCAQFQEPLPGRKPIEQVWYTGRMHGETVAKNILGRRTAYNPGVWFNSAKFFDIEYQVYGDVGNRVRENEEHLYWEHPNGKRSIRLVYHKENLKFIGINLMGIRYRHEVCNEWIEKGYTISKVLFDLKRAIFDPEFYDTHEDEIIAIYNSKNPLGKVKISGRKGLLKAILP
jgi:NADPH-dependent 2,4-dienoyl-CoA reductase/sulfur reductase-like enzyme